MEVDEKTALSGEKDGKTWYFCSPGCKEEFLGAEISPEEPSTFAEASVDGGARSQEPGEENVDLEPEPEPELAHSHEPALAPEPDGEVCEIPLPGELNEPSMKSVSMGITGMHCASCAANTEKALGKLDGVQSASVNIASESASVQYDPGCWLHGPSQGGARQKRHNWNHGDALCFMCIDYRKSFVEA
jgi:YHS domain-containing protein